MQEGVSRKLNIGCGNNKIHGYINIDVNSELDPDLTIDIRKECLPFEEGSCSEILMFHTIEHIEEKYHGFILSEFHRVLELNGSILITYPEFIKCAKNYINNFQGKREFWKHTIYGLQRSPSDFHVSLMDTNLFVDLLQEIGFVGIIYKPETDEPFNTMLIADKGKVPRSYEDLLNESTESVVLIK